MCSNNGQPVHSVGPLLYFQFAAWHIRYQICNTMSMVMRSPSAKCTHIDLQMVLLLLAFCRHRRRYCCCRRRRRRRFFYCVLALSVWLTVCLAVLLFFCCCLLLRQFHLHFPLASLTKYIFCKCLQFLSVVHTNRNSCLSLFRLSILSTIFLSTILHYTAYFIYLFIYFRWIFHYYYYFFVHSLFLYFKLLLLLFFSSFVAFVHGS